MAVSTGDLQTLRDNLVRSRSAGLREVRDSTGETVIYKSDAEMAAAIASLNAQIAAAGQPQPVNTIQFRTSKGL